MASRLNRRRRRRAVRVGRLQSTFIVTLAVFAVILIVTIGPPLLRISRQTSQSDEDGNRGTEEDKGKSAPDASLGIVIRDAATGKPVSDAVFGVGGQYRTVAGGKAARVAGLQAERLRLEVRAPGYHVLRREMFISAGDNSATIMLEPLDKGQSKKVRSDSPGALVRSSRRAYLTIDDGPNPRWTPKVLDVLDRAEVRATFFVIGRRSKRYPEIIRRIYVEGHALGNHTYAHDYASLYGGSVQPYLDSLRANGTLLKEILGYEPRLTRPPGGETGNFRSGWRSAVRSAGYQTVLWNVSSGDGTGTTSEQMISNVISYLERLDDDDEPVILTHDVRPPIIEALPEIIFEVRRRGYEFAVLGD